MSGHRRDLYRKYILLQSGPDRQRELYSIKRNCRYIINIKAVNSIGYTTEEEALHGDIVLSVTADLSAEAWGSQTEAGKGTITLL